MQIQLMFIIAFQQESQSRYTLSFDIWQARGQILSTNLSCGSIYFNVIGSKRLSTGATIASDEIRPGKHRHLKSE